MPSKSSTTEASAPKNQEEVYRYWNGQISDALTREKKYRKIGHQCVGLYEAKDPSAVPFSILYANTETLAPAVYNARPIPIVQRRYKDPDPLGKAVADVSTRTLKYLVDTENADYDSFDDLMNPAVIDALVTNRGVTRFKYVAHDEGSYSPECVYGESVRWDKFFHGYARTWKKVPWIGFEWDMSEDEVRKNFPDKPIDFKNLSFSAEADEDGDRSESTQELKGVKLVKVFEIWDKRSRKVFFFSPCYTKGPLREADDPLELSGFFPIPRPMNFLRRITTLVPIPLYEHYRSQAAELNEITRRLKAIIKAIRFRGAYNAAVDGIDKMLKAEDNELVPVENVQSMPDGTGMDKLIWTVPTNELATTAQSLYQQREAIKMTIYEITGISDILRGASVASETATAQNIKNQWGTLRLKKMQKEVQRYCREALAIMLEIASKRFEQQTFMKMTGAPYLTAGQKAEVAQMQQMAAMTQQIGPAQMQPPAGPGAPPGMPPMAGPPMVAQQPPPAPPSLPPEISALMEQPSWEEIYATLQNSVLASYKTDIETNSTIDAEAAQDKQDIAELMTAISQFLQGVSPLVEKGVLSMDLAKNMLLTICRRYNFGPQLEDSINLMKEPEAKADPAEAAKAEMAKAEMAAKTQEHQQSMELAKLEFSQKQQEMRAKGQLALLELDIKRQELTLQAKAVALKLQQQDAAHKQKMETIAATANAKTEKEPANASV